mmetsp:Transcript_71304/g.126001  ORF Transcript_71304/g.126001 Transcript_71304/m.126001 type:complete len:318 (-) Transcript_71304:213-1166(-)|eukprot:CAMPEP_0197656202 /NCGR_PEP_ID=MMETSP1338-20131121/40745_1 /TAXON_ID=43686 ORGANISM="Pelagodinium beii, Strain RCC1491" /NCGR_SAMPLE_ID=MMETSP1338 /ASSEMBLY_ACC=CAM_ASM_000754 /LENGTH=317 /DNA_ID=CAMNT_0043232083 /DNA_START=81 /DNA_END=1034 /DNA_ORIENTATION=+
MDQGAAIKKIGDELKAKFDECGMGKVEEMVDKLEEVKTLAEAGPGALVEKIEAAMKDLAGKMEEVVKDPASLAPGGGMAACADWYGSSVAGKLTSLSDETKGMQETVMKLASDVGDPMKKLTEVLGGAMKELESSLKRLSKLPAEVTKLGDTVKGPDDVAKIDTASMSKATDTSPIEGILTKIMGLKDVLAPAVEAATAAIQKLADFVASAPDMIRGAFDVPTPLCFLTSVLLSQAPAAMTSLLEMVDKLKGVDMQPMLTMLKDTSDTVLGLDASQVKAPVESFGTFAKEKVDSLDSIVKAAKSAGGMAAMGKKLGF